MQVHFPRLLAQSNRLLQNHHHDVSSKEIPSSREKDTSLDKKLEFKDSVNRVHLLIENLPNQEKLIIQLRDIEQYEFEEICNMLDMKPTAVRVTLSRARKKIREALIKQHNHGVC